MVKQPSTYPEIVSDVPQFVQLETTSRCNLFCRTCLKPYTIDRWLEADMNLDLFRAIIDQLSGKPTIHLQGWGEPLLHPETLQHILIIKERGLQVSLTSNGTLLDLQLAKDLLDAGLDGITFSMAGHSIGSQDSLRGEGTCVKVHEAIALMAEVRKRSGKRTLKIGVSYLVTPETVAELPEAITWCRKNDVDLFATVHLTQVASNEQKGMHFRLPWPLPLKYRLLRIQSHARATFGSMRLNLCSFSAGLTPVCDKDPLRNIFINVQGEVSPCVFLSTPVQGEITWQHAGYARAGGNVIFGNVRNSCLQEIWESEGYVSFRDAYKTRQQYHDSMLAKVSYSMAGAEELKKAVTHIESYFVGHPPPEGCKSCYKLDGF
jgi:MoaA/NifB/PqqE/SkfB family radical SAM enzyme